MSFQDAPTLDKLPSVRLPGREELAKRQAQRRMWVLIGVFAAALIALIVINLVQSGALEAFKGKGTVVGTVVDENNAPLRAYVFILGTTLEVETDASGRFELRNVPEGQQEIIVGYLGAARAFPLWVQANTVNDMGTVQFVSTRVP